MGVHIQKIALFLDFNSENLHGSGTSIWKSLCWQNTQAQGTCHMYSTTWLCYENISSVFINLAWVSWMVETQKKLLQTKYHKWHTSANRLTIPNNLGSEKLTCSIHPLTSVQNKANICTLSATECESIFESMKQQVTSIHIYEYLSDGQKSIIRER